MLLNLILVIEALSFFVSLILLKRRKPPLYIRFFPVFLFVTVVQESIGYTIVGKSPFYFPMINVYTVFEFAFYSFVLYHLIKAPRVKLVIVYSIISYAILTLIYSMLMGNAFTSTPYILGATALVCFCMYYFYEFFKYPVFKNPIHEPTFWICFGIVFFKSCTMPLFGIFNYWGYSAIEKNVLILILSISNYFLYGSFIIAFICFYRTRMQHNNENQLRLNLKNKTVFSGSKKTNNSDKCDTEAVTEAHTLAIPECKTLL